MNTPSNAAFYCCGVRMQDAEREFSLCGDHYAKRFFDKFAHEMHSKLVETDGTFTDRPDEPAQIFAANGYAQVDAVSILRRAFDLGALKSLAGIPTLAGWSMLNIFAKDVNGYAVHRFKPDRA